MRKTIIAGLVFVPTLFLSGCYVATAPATTYYAGYNYAGYTPGWHSSYNRWGGGYYRSGWYGNRGWYNSGFRNRWGGYHGGWHRR